MNGKNILASIAFLMLCTIGQSQPFTFVITDGLPDGNLKERIEENASKLLTALNEAYDKNSSSIHYPEDIIHDSASNNIGVLWKQFHYHTEKANKYATYCAKLDGTEDIYILRNIGMIITPVEGVVYRGEKRREVSIYCDKTGMIVDFDFSLGINEYENIIKKGEEVGDLDKRMRIVNWCNYLAEAYCEKDISFIEDVFNDDALILVGNVKTKRIRTNDRIVIKKESTYKQYSKEKYIRHLKEVFERNGYVNVKFEDLEIKRDGYNPNYYGVTLKQKYRSTTYSDEGILFLVWDFTDEEHPKIQVRVWQKEEQERFSTADFKLPSR